MNDKLKTALPKPAKSDNGRHVVSKRIQQIGEYGNKVDNLQNTNRQRSSSRNLESGTEAIRSRDPYFGRDPNSIDGNNGDVKPNASKGKIPKGGQIAPIQIEGDKQK